jgi:hypothetical protein
MPPSDVVEPVPPYAMPSEEVAVTAPLAEVVRRAEVMPGRETVPPEEMEKKVEVAVPADEEPMAKRVEGVRER